jgi:hypothetical protein
MAQFYISHDSEDDAKRCRESVLSKQKILITGSTIDRQHFKSFEGVVQSMDEDASRGVGKRYKVTILD